MDILRFTVNCRSRRRVKDAILGRPISFRRPQITMLRHNVENWCCSRTWERLIHWLRIIHRSTGTAVSAILPGRIRVENDAGACRRPKRLSPKKIRTIRDPRHSHPRHGPMGLCSLLQKQKRNFPPLDHRRQKVPKRRPPRGPNNQRPPRVQKALLPKPVSHAIPST